MVSNLDTKGGPRLYLIAAAQLISFFYGMLFPFPPLMNSPLIQSGIALQVGHFDDKSGNEGVASVYFAKEHFPEENDALKWWQANRTRLQRGV